MRIFADLHHGSLFMSLKLLAIRLGASIHRPIGEDWFTEGYWKIAEVYGNHPDTIKQYLSTEPYQDLPFYNNKEAQEFQIKGQYLINDDAHHSYDLAMTLELFKQVSFDVLIVSYPQHLESWIELQKKYQPKAKLVLQVGNNGWARYFEHVQNVLSSARHHVAIPRGLNYIEYHQEFPLDIFKPAVQKPDKLITSFVNCLPRPELYKIFQDALPEYTFEAYGGSCPQGSMSGIKLMADKMAQSQFGYHVKPGGDGYGHVLHNWFAVGRPPIVLMQDYQGTMGGDLLVPYETCIPIDEGIVKAIQTIQDKSCVHYEVMCEKVYDRFVNTVNFDYEWDTKLKPFFERLL